MFTLTFIGLINNKVGLIHDPCRKLGKNPPFLKLLFNHLVKTRLKF